jgi:transcription antitermination factor NusG
MESDVASLASLNGAKASMRDRMSDDALDNGILDVAAGLHWYALLVAPQKEFVAQKILRRYGLRTFVPVRREWRRVNKFTADKLLRAFPLAPRYVFAGFKPGVPLWFDLFALPVVSGAVCICDRPMRLPTGEVVKMIRKLGGGLNAAEAARFMRTHHEFAVGDTVEVTAGPFEGMRVPVVSISGPRARVLLSLFGGAVDTIDMALDDLQAA